MKVIAIVQARIGSTRLPGKVMKKISGKTVLNHVIERLSLSREIDDIVIATTTSEIDKEIEDEARKIGAKSFRGSESNVLSRYYLAAERNNAEIVVRITSDCPLIDPFIIDEMIKTFKNNNFDIVSNAGSDLENRSFPRGLDTEVFSFEVLKNAFVKAEKDYEKEHVTPHIYENSNKIFFYKNNIDYSKYRWTLDTLDDYKLITIIYENLYKGEHNFFMNEILKLFNTNPSLIEINNFVEQKKIK